MDTLSYLATFVSLILGLGVANVLAQFAGLVKRGESVRWYWVHTSWGVFLLLAMASEWWILLQWRVVPEINYFNFISFLFKPAILFFASDLLFPERSDGPATDLKEHFLSVAPVMYFVCALYPIADLVDTTAKGWQHLVGLGPVYPLTMSTIFIGSLLGTKRRGERFHIAYTAVGYSSLIVGITNALMRVR